MEDETGSTDRVRDGEAGPARMKGRFTFSDARQRAVEKKTMRRNFVGLWPFGVIVLLLGFIACQGYDRDRSDGTSSTQPMLDTGPLPTPPSPLPTSVTDELKNALDAAAQTPPATPQPTPNPPPRQRQTRTKPRRRSNSPAPNPCSSRGLNKRHCLRLSSNSRSSSSGNRRNAPSENASSIGRPKPERSELSSLLWLLGTRARSARR